MIFKNYRKFFFKSEIFTNFYSYIDIFLFFLHIFIYIFLKLMIFWFYLLICISRSLGWCWKKQWYWWLQDLSDPLLQTRASFSKLRIANCSKCYRILWYNFVYIFPHSGIFCFALTLYSNNFCCVLLSKQKRPSVSR